LNQFELFQPYVNFIHNSRQTGTYQFVFLKSLFYLAGYKNPKLDISWGEDWIREDEESLKVDLEFFVVPFIKYYWDMLYKFRLKQSATRNQYGDDDINIHKHFKDADGEIKQPPDIKELAGGEYKDKREKIIYGDPGSMNSSFREVLFALDHYGFFKARKPKLRTINLRTMDNFLEFDIQIPDFLYKYASNSILDSAINYLLTKYLEGINPFIPQIAKKVLIDIPRGKLRANEDAEYNKLYKKPGMFECFYCHCKKKVGDGEPARDHVIPFDFVLNDDLYNSVPTCKSCNSTKSNKLPEQEIFDAVILRNEEIINKPGYTKEEFQKLYNYCNDYYHGNREFFHYQRCTE